MAEISVDFGKVVLALKPILLADPGMHRSWELPAQVAKALGVYDSWVNPRTYDERQAYERFNGQVARAGDRLDRDGVVRKVGKGKTGPGAQRYSDVTYFTPAAWKAAEEKVEREQAEAAALRTRWEMVYDWYDANVGGLVPVPNIPRSRARGAMVRLDLDAMERVMDALNLHLPVPSGDRLVCTEDRRNWPCQTRQKLKDGE